MNLDSNEFSEMQMIVGVMAGILGGMSVAGLAYAVIVKRKQGA